MSLIFHPLRSSRSQGRGQNACLDLASEGIVRALVGRLAGNSNANRSKDTLKQGQSRLHQGQAMWAAGDTRGARRQTRWSCCCLFSLNRLADGKLLRRLLVRTP